MDVVNFPAIVANGQLLNESQIDHVNDLLLIGKKVNNKKDGSQYQEMAIAVGDLVSQVPYKVYVALLSQSGKGNPPTAIVLENTIGDIVWLYDAAGEYLGKLGGAFPNQDKFFTLNHKNMVDAQTYIGIKWENVNTFSVKTSFVTYNPVEGSTPQNSMMSNYPIEIRVYN